jgi:hypothetical protein
MSSDTDHGYTDADLDAAVAFMKAHHGDPSDRDVAQLVADVREATSARAETNRATEDRELIALVRAEERERCANVRGGSMSARELSMSDRTRDALLLGIATRGLGGPALLEAKDDDRKRAYAFWLASTSGAPEQELRTFSLEAVARLIRTVRAEERERCARIAESEAQVSGGHDPADHIAKRIREQKP